MVLSLIWMLVLRYAAGLMTWVAVWAANLLFVLCTLLCFMKVRLCWAPSLPLCPVHGLTWRPLLMRCCLQSGTLGGAKRFFAVGSEVATQLASYEDPSASDRRVWKVAGYVVLALTAILILVTLVMVRRIKVNSLPVCRAPACSTGLPWLPAGAQRAEQADVSCCVCRWL